MGAKPMDQLVEAHISDFFTDPVPSMSHTLDAIECLRRGSSSPWSSRGVPDLEKGITSLEVDRVVCMDSLQIDDVLEIPTDANIDSSNVGKGYMHGIRTHASAESVTGTSA